MKLDKAISVLEGMFPEATIGPHGDWPRVMIRVNGWGWATTTPPPDEKDLVAWAETEAEKARFFFSKAIAG